MVKIFEREYSPDSPPTCPRPVGKLRSVSTPIPKATKAFVRSSGGKGPRHVTDRVSFPPRESKGKGPSPSLAAGVKEEPDKIDHAAEGEETVTNAGCITAAAEDGGDAEDPGNECSSVYSQYSGADGTVDKDNDSKEAQDQHGTASGSNPQPSRLKESSMDTLLAQDKLTDTSYELQPSTPKTRPVKTPRTLPSPINLSPLNRPHPPSLPGPLSALLSDAQSDPESVPLPLTPHDPAAAAF